MSKIIYIKSLFFVVSILRGLPMYRRIKHVYTLDFSKIGLYENIECSENAFLENTCIPTSHA